jgi:O-antigen/teichoic acid export membrane protein
MVVTSRVSPISFPVDRQLLGGVLRSALPFVLIGGIYMIGYRVDVLMLSRMAGDAAVGSYGAAYTPIELVVSISQLLTAALFPALSQAFGASLTAFRVIVARSMKIFLALSLPMSVGIFLLAPQILGTMFSEEFDVGTGTLQILGAAVWIFFLQIIVGWLLTAADRLRTLVTINVVTLILNLASNFVLIPRYGAAGAAASQVICSAVALSVLVTVAHSAGVLSLAGLRPLRMLFAVGVMGVVTYALREMNVFVVVAAAALLYLALLRATRTVDPEELAELRGMFRGTLRSQPPEPQRG